MSELVDKSIAAKFQSNHQTDPSKAQGTYLTYGTRILISSGENPTKDSFILSARATHNPLVYYARAHEKVESLTQLYPCFQDSIFVVVPRLNYEINALYDEMDESDPAKESLAKRKNVEDEVNSSVIRELVGKAIKLGDMIQLYHPITQKFLVISNLKGFAGDHNLMGLSNKSSVLSHYRIRSPLAFRKTGSNILLGDEFYLLSGTKTMVFPLQKSVINRSVISLKGQESESFGEKWESQDIEKLRLTNLPENQRLFMPIQSGNILNTAMGENYSNRFKAALVPYQENMLSQPSSTEFFFGDFITIHKMDDAGLSNSLFAEVNLSSFKDEVLLRINKNSKARYLTGIEGVFQILPLRLEDFGTPVSYGDFQEVSLCLKHILSGKMLYYSRKEKKFKLCPDFGIFKKTIDNNKRSIVNEFEDRWDQYFDILNDDTITDKDNILKEKFTKAEMDLFQTTDRICEDENVYDEQYIRETTVNLQIFSKGDTSVQSSSYFTFRSFHNTNIRIRQDDDFIQSLKDNQEKGSKIDKKFVQEFNYDNDFDLQTSIAVDPTKPTEKADFFYFEKAREFDFNLIENMNSILSDLVKYQKNSIFDKNNISSVLFALDFLIESYNSEVLSIKQFQNFLRQSCMIDISMLILQKIYVSEDLNPRNELGPLRIFKQIIKILEIFVKNSQISSQYSYQWKNFYRKWLETELLLKGKVPEFGIVISTIFENTNNYETYLNFNLEDTCKELDFNVFHKDELLQLLKMLRTVVKMKDELIDELVLKTIIFSKFKDKMFYPIKLGLTGFAEIEVGSATVLKIDGLFAIGQKVESDYLVDLVNVASILTKLAPNRVAGEMQNKFPKNICLKIITDFELEGKLRGAFVQLYTSLYIQREIIKFDLAHVETNIISKEGQTPFLYENEDKIHSLRQEVFTNADINLVDLIMNNFSVHNTEFTSSLMKLSLFGLENHMFSSEEEIRLEEQLKEILYKHAIPSSDDSEGIPMKRLFTAKGGPSMVEGGTDLGINMSKTVPVSTLQNEPWMTDLVKCLIKIENRKNTSKWMNFTLQDAVNLNIDSENLRRKYKDLSNDDKTEKRMEKDRKAIKQLMDKKKNEDLTIPRYLIELINPNKPGLSEEVLRYLNLLLTTDELTLENYVQKYSIADSASTEAKGDFIETIKNCYNIKKAIVILQRSIRQKEKNKVEEEFVEFSGMLKNLVVQIFRTIGPDDQLKKHELNFEMLSNNDIIVEDFEISKLDKVFKTEKTFFFNILNYFLGKTTNYKNRKSVILDFDLLEKSFDLFIKLFNFQKIFKTQFEASNSDDSDQLPFEIVTQFKSGNIFGEELSSVLTYLLLVANYVFLIQSDYNREFLKRMSNKMISLLKILQDPKNKISKQLKLLALKFVATLLKDNYSVLVSLDLKFVDYLFTCFEESLDRKDYEFSVAYLEIFEIMVEFRDVGIIENAYIVYSKLSSILNAKGSILRFLLDSTIPKWFKDNTVAKQTKQVDYSDSSWKDFYSDKKAQLANTREKPAIYIAAKMPAEVYISYQVFNIMKVVMFSNDPSLQSSLKSQFSLGYLLNMIKDANEWYFMKRSIIDFVRVLYVQKNIVAGNMNLLLLSLENQIYSDFKLFDTYLKKPSGSNDVLLITGMDSIKTNYLEESVYKPYFGHTSFNKNDSMKSYSVKGIGNLLLALLKLLEFPGKLKNLDITIFRKFLKNYSDYNRTKQAIIATEVSRHSPHPDHKEESQQDFGPTNRDEFFLKFAPKDDSKNKKDSNLLEILEECRFQCSVYQTNFLASTFNEIKSQYLSKVTKSFRDGDLDVQELLMLKKQLLKEDFVYTLNQQDYNVFIDNSLTVLKENPLKFELFLKDIVSLLKLKGQDFKSLERKITMLRRIIERSSNSKETLNLLSSLGLFTELIEKYVENSQDQDMTILIVRFITRCVSLGLESVQAVIIESLHQDPINSFLNEVTQNLDLGFSKFAQRQNLRSKFTGFGKLKKEDQNDIEKPITESADYYIHHLEMLRYFCEGHYLPMQEYLRVQSYKGKNKPNQVNVLSIAEKHLKLYSKMITEDNYEVGETILSFFAEMVQGPCPSNQQEISGSKVIEILEEMTTSIILTDLDMDQGVKSKLVRQIIAILLGVLESNNDSLTISKVALNTNNDALWERLVQIQALFDGNKKYFEEIRAQADRLNPNKILTDDEFYDEQKPKPMNTKSMKIYNESGTDYSEMCHEGGNIAILFQQLKSFNADYDNLVEREYRAKIRRKSTRQALAKKARKFFFGLVKSIEVNIDKNRIERVFFLTPAITRFHSSFSKDYFNETVDRRVPSTKLGGLSKEIPLMLFEMKHFAKYYQKGWSLDLSILKNFRVINFCLALIINLIIMVFPGIDNEQVTKKAFDLDKLKPVEWVLFGFCCVLLLMYVLTIICWFVLSYSIDKHQYKLETREEKKKEMTQEDYEEDQRNGGKRVHVSGLSVLWGIFTTTYLPVALALLAVCILGMTLSKLFLSFLLLDMITLNPLLKNVIRAFTLKTKALLVTFTFGVIQIFIYTSITYFSLLRKNLQFIDDDKLEMCYNYLHCFIMTLNFGMRSGGGIGEALLYPGYKGNIKLYLFRSAFDILFFITIIIIILEIVFGLIIDSFGELRELRDIKLNDISSKCFICDIEDQVFSRESLSFSKHRSDRHNHWNYCYYVIGLLLKNIDQMNGTESFVLKKYNTKELTWFPVGKAIELTEDKLEKGIEEKIDQIQESVDGCISQLSKISKEIKIKLQSIKPSK